MTLGARLDRNSKFSAVKLAKGASLCIWWAHVKMYLQVNSTDVEFMNRQVCTVCMIEWVGTTVPLKHPSLIPGFPGHSHLVGASAALTPQAPAQGPRAVSCCCPGSAPVEGPACRQESLRDRQLALLRDMLGLGQDELMPAASPAFPPAPELPVAPSPKCGLASWLPGLCTYCSRHLAVERQPLSAEV